MTAFNFKNMIRIVLITVSLLIVPFISRAQSEEYLYDYSVVVGTSDSRMFLTVNEADDRVEFQISSIGKINARAFLTSMVYDTTNLVLTDNTYLYDIPEFEFQSQSTSPVISMPASFMNKFPNFSTGLNMHLPILDGDGLGMKLITTSIGLHNLTSSPVSLESGEMIHTYSIHYRKKTPGKPLLPSDFGFFAQPPLIPMKPLASTMWNYFAMSIRNCTGQPGEWIVYKPQFFSFRSPSYVNTETVTNITASSVILNATFTRGDIPPTNIIKTGYFNADFSTQLNWDAVTKYGFIYSDTDADILVNGFSTKLNIDGIDCDFPSPAEVAAGNFSRNGKTFFIQQLQNYSSEQDVPFSQTVTNLEGGYYYAWSFIHYTYETSYPHLNVGNKVTFKVNCGVLDEHPVVYAENLIYCSGEAVPEYTFEGTQDATYYWQRIAGYDFGLDVTEGVNTIPAFVAQNYGFEYVSALYRVTPVNEDGCTGDPQQFLITVNPKPITSPVEDMVYCNGVTVPKLDFSSNMPDVIFEWEFVNEAGSVMIEGIPTFGENFIPGFLTQNTGSEPKTGKYRVRASYSYNNLTCYDEVWQYFNIVVLPTPTVTSTPPHQTVCSGETTLPVLFFGNVSNATYQWHRVSGNIPELPFSGSGNFESYTLHNTGAVIMETMYEVVPMLNYPQYSGYTCPGAPTQFSISVLPQPHINTIPAMVYCSGETTQGFEFGNTSGVFYTWQLTNGVNVGLAESGTGQLPSFITVNNSNNEVLEAIYQVTATYNMYDHECSHSATFSIIVNPTPSVDPNIAPYQFCAGAETPVIDFTVLFAGLNNPAGTVYEWHCVSDNYIGLDQESGINIIPSFVPTNNSNHLITSSFKVRAKLGNCTGDEKMFKISVIPQLSVTSLEHAGTICSGAPFEYTIVTNIPVEEILWVRLPHPDINNNEGANGQYAYINEVLNNNGTSDVTVTYFVSLVAGGCGYENIGEVVVVVSPNIVVNMNQVINACSDDSSIVLEYDINIQGAQYTLFFGTEGQAVGFIGVHDYIPLPESNIIIHMPKKEISGRFSATLNIQYGNCIKIYDVVIVIDRAPEVINLSEPVIMLCDDEDLFIFIEVEGDVEYQWYFNGNILPKETESYYKSIFNINNEGEYAVEVSNRCGTTTHYFTVIQNQTMIKMKWDDVMYVSNSNNIYLGYQWYKDGQPIAQNGTNQYYSETGGFTPFSEYTVRAYKSDGTYDEACPIVPNTELAPINSGLIIYPNPTQSGNEVTFMLKLPEGEWANADAFIYDMTGKVVKQFKIVTSLTRIMLNTASGTYAVRVITENGDEFIEKLIIQK